MLTERRHEISRLEQFSDAGLQRQTRRSQSLEVPSPRRDQGLKRIVGAVVVEQEAMVHLARPANQLQEDVMAHRASDFARGRQDRLGVEPFTVEQQAVHVEDNGRRLSGKRHRRAASSASASSTNPAPERAVVIQRGR